jgi:hypothetical protein
MCSTRRIRLGLFLVLTLVSGKVAGQGSSSEPSSRPRIAYSNQFLAGPVFGDDAHDASFHASTFHGLSFKRFMVAPGLSYDIYDSWKIWHYAVTTRVDLTNTEKGAVIFSLTGGIDASIKNHNEGEYGVNYSNTNASMLQASLGYRFRFEKASIYLMGGYRMQKLSYDQTPRWFVMDAMYGQPWIQHVDRDMRRVVVTLGFGLN